MSGRWEWRAFGVAGVSLGVPDRVEESDEVYLLTETSDASVKLRAGLVDVKRLQTVEGGLEQWLPVLKAPQPLSDADAAVVRATVGDGEQHRVGVHKHRERHTYEGCMAELTEMRTEHGATSTLAVEGEDAERVSAAVRGLGFDPRRNTCVARGLKTLAGIGARRFAIIDTGTNSVKFHVGERRADGTWTKVVDRAEVTRLGEGLDDTKQLSAPAIERTAAAITGMVDEAQALGAESIAAVGTAALRIAPNGGDLAARCGVAIEVLPGEEEARLAYLGASAAVGAVEGARVVFDTGGGSSQFTFGDAERVAERFSLPVGAVRFTERFGLAGAVSEATLEEALAAIAAELATLGERPAPAAVLGMGGALTNLAAVKHELATYDPDVVQGSVLDRAEIERQIELYRARDAEQRRAIVGLQANRAEVILAGACIVRTVLTLLGADTLTVSDRGLRHGLIAERFALGPPVSAPLTAAP